jgi:hypothetical protein
LRSPSAHSLEHVRSYLARVQGDLQQQIDALALRLNEGRLNDQRAQHRDRELIMQAIFKQRSDVDARLAASSAEAAGTATKAAEGAIVAAMERESSERGKIRSAQLLEEEATRKMIQVRLL